VIPINKWEKVLGVLLLLFIAAKILVVMQAHTPIWDEAVYTGMGKHISSGGASGLWEPIRPVGLPLVLGLIFITGLPFELSAEIALLAFSVGLLALVYLLAKKIFNAPTGILAVLLMMWTSVFFVQSSLILTEVPSTFFAVLSLYLLTQRRLFFSGMSAGMAALFKFPHVLLPVAIAAFICIAVAHRDRVHAALVAGAGYAVIAGPLLLFHAVRYGSALEPFLLASSHQANPLLVVHGIAANALFYLASAVRENVFFLFVPVGIYAILREKNKESAGVAVAAILYLVYFTFIPNKQERFLLLFLPFFAIISAYGFYSLLVGMRGSTWKSATILAVIVMVAGASAYGTLMSDAEWYRYRGSVEHGIYDLPVRGTVLTSDPVFAYYNDNLFIPYYFSTADGEGIAARRDALIDRMATAEAVVYSADGFYCAQGDERCSEALSAVGEALDKRQKISLGENHLLYMLR
jgi:hypothetical protein